MLEIRSWLKYYLKDFNRDEGGRDIIIRKPNGIYKIIDGCLIIGARESIKEGDYY